MARRGGDGSEGLEEAAASPDGLMVFDGHCNACSAGVRTVLRADRAGDIRFTSIQSPYGRHLAGRFSIDADDPSTFLFFDRGRPLTASDAAIALARRLPAPYSFLAVVALVPRALRDGVYRFVARHRYRLAGRRETCMVPPPEHRARFVEDVPADRGGDDGPTRTRPRRACDQPSTATSVRHPSASGACGSRTPKNCTTSVPARS